MCVQLQIGCKLPWDRFPWSHNETCASIHQYRFIILMPPISTSFPNVSIFEGGTEILLEIHYHMIPT